MQESLLLAQGEMQYQILEWVNCGIKQGRKLSCLSDNATTTTTTHYHVHVLNVKGEYWNSVLYMRLWWVCICFLLWQRMTVYIQRCVTAHQHMRFTYCRVSDRQLSIFMAARLFMLSCTMFARLCWFRSCCVGSFIPAVCVTVTEGPRTLVRRRALDCMLTKCSQSQQLLVGSLVCKVHVVCHPRWLVTSTHA